MKSKNTKIFYTALIVIVFVAIIMIAALLIFKSKQADETYLHHGTGTVSGIDYKKKEITLTNIEYGDGKKLDRLILIVDEVDLYDVNEERINLDNIQKTHKLQFYYFDTEEYLLDENAEIKPNSIYDLSK